MIGLQTSFGGGKTHTLLAVYHLARHLSEGGDPADLPGLGPLVEKLGTVEWRKPKLAAFVGSAKGTDVSLTLNDGPPVRTLWGYLAWRDRRRGRSQVGRRSRSGARQPRLRIDGRGLLPARRPDA